MTKPSLRNKYKTIKNITRKNRKILKRKQKKGGQSNKYDEYKLCFINQFQNGDIYISSEFIIDIKNKVKNDIKYYMELKENRLENFEFMNIPLMEFTYDNKRQFITVDNDKKEIIINTWVAIIKNFIGEKDIYLPLYYEQFKELYSLLNIKIEDIEYYIPSFNQPSFTKYPENLQIIKNIYDKIPKKKVLLCNGVALSRSNIFDQKIIKFFIDNNYFVKVTNIDSISDPDILNAYNNNISNYDDIIKKDNLLYINNIIASQSDIIVGLASGLFFTTFSKETLNKQFILLAPENHILYEKFNSNFININNESSTIIKEIENIITK